MANPHLRTHLERPKTKTDYALMPGQDGEGSPVFSVLVKRTYDILPGQAAARAAEDRPLAADRRILRHGGRPRPRR